MQYSATSSHREDISTMPPKIYDPEDPRVELLYGNIEG